MRQNSLFFPAQSNKTIAAAAGDGYLRVKVNKESPGSSPESVKPDSGIKKAGLNNVYQF
ncbi:MAG TPA: hypothetical protein VM123_12580 [archaeon]|nr:hypothetical protein [archaeon]